MAKINIVKTIKITLGCCLAVVIAKILDLNYSNSVVTITLLSILNTKKDTLITAGKRCLAFFFATTIAWISFTWFQFSLAGLGVYLFFIVIACQYFELTDGLSMSTVLMLHLWTEKNITISGLLNEATLMAIGILMGIFMNLYMPNQIKKIHCCQTMIEQHFEKLLLCFSDHLLLKDRSTEIQHHFQALSSDFQKSIEATDLHVNNHLFSHTGYYLQYLKMRLKQFEVLQIIASNLQRINYVPSQSTDISAYLKQVAYSISKHDNAQELLDCLQKMRMRFRNANLPINRQEFETRAVLYEIVNDVQYLLRIKQEFAESLSPYQIRTFWETKNSP